MTPLHHRPPLHRELFSFHEAENHFDRHTAQCLRAARRPPDCRAIRRLGRQHTRLALAARSRWPDGDGLGTRRLHELRRLELRRSASLDRARSYRRRQHVARYTDRSGRKAQRDAANLARAAPHVRGSRARAWASRGRRLFSLSDGRWQRDRFSEQHGDRGDRS